MLLVEALLAKSDGVVPVFVRVPLYKEKLINCDSIGRIFDIGEKIIEDSCRVYLNGLRLAYGAHYTATNNGVITLMDDAMPGDIIIIEYIKGE